MSEIPEHIETLGVAIRWGREQKRLTLRALAAQIGVSTAFVCDIEHDRRTPQDLGPFAKALDVDETHLARLKGRTPRGMAEFLERHPELRAVIAEQQRACRCPRCLVIGGSR